MSGFALLAVLLAGATALAFAVRWGFLRVGETPRRAGLLAAGVVALAVAGAAAFSFDQLGDEGGKVPRQPNALTSNQVQARTERWKRDRRPPYDETDCDIASPQVEVARHDAWIEVSYEFETLPRSPMCRPYAVVGVLISGAPEEGRLTSISRARVTDRNGTVILSLRPLRGRPPKRADISALAISGSSSAVVSVRLGPTTAP